MGVPWLHPLNLFRYTALALLVALAVFANRVLHSIAALVLLTMLIVFAVTLADG